MLSKNKSTDAQLRTSEPVTLYTKGIQVSCLTCITIFKFYADPKILHSPSCTHFLASLTLTIFKCLTKVNSMFKTSAVFLLEGDITQGIHDIKWYVRSVHFFVMSPTDDVRTRKAPRVEDQIVTDKQGRRR